MMAPSKLDVPVIIPSLLPCLCRNFLSYGIVNAVGPVFGALCSGIYAELVEDDAILDDRAQ